MSAGSAFDIVVRDRISASILTRLTAIEAAATRASAAIAGMGASMGGAASATTACGAAATSASRRILSFAFGIRTAQQNALAFTNSIRRTGQAMRAFASGILLLGATGSIIHAADSYRTLQNTLRGVTTNQTQLNEATRQLYDIADRARVPVSSLTKSFRRFDQALSQTEAGQEESLRITETVAKAITLSGASSDEAASSLLQLSQAFNKGKLDGDEFRTTAENMPDLIDAIAKVTGITRGEIYDFSKEGKISVDVLRKAFAEMATDVDARMKNLPRTIGQALTQFGNKASLMFGQFDMKTGFVDSINGFIDNLANNLPTVINLLKAFGAAFAIMITPSVLALFNPISAFLLSVPGAIAAATAFLAYFSDEIKVSADGVVTLSDVLRAIVDDARGATTGILDFIRATTGIDLTNIFNAENAQMLYDTIVSIAGAIKSAIQQAVVFTSAIGDALGTVAMNPRGMDASNQMFPGSAFLEELILAPIANIGDFILDIGIKIINGIEDPLKSVAKTLDLIIKQFGMIAEQLGKLSPGSMMGFGNPLQGLANQMKQGLNLPANFDSQKGIMSAGLKSMKTDWDKEFPVFQQFVEQFDKAWEQGKANMAKTDQAYFDGLIARAREYADKRIAVEKQIQEQSQANPGALRQADAEKAAFYQQMQELTRAKEAIADLQKKGGMNSILSDKNNGFNPEFKVKVAESQLATEGFSKSILNVVFGLTTMDEHMKQVLSTMQQYKQQAEQVKPEATATPATTDSTSLEQTQSTIGSIVQSAGQLALSFIGVDASVQTVSTAISGLQPAFTEASTEASMFSNIASTAFTITESMAQQTADTIGSAIASAASQASAAISSFANSAIADFNAVSNAAANVQVPSGGGGGGGLFGFADGGYTGNGSTSSIAGVVHGREYVMPADQTARYRPILDAMRAGRSIPTGGGSGGSGVNVQVQNFGSSQISVERLSANDIRIIAREESARTVQQQAPLVVANHLRNPNSKVSKSIQQNTSASRRR